jgi:tetratricopeptide (TPR) repeat protein
MLDSTPPTPSRRRSIALSPAFTFLFLAWAVLAVACGGTIDDRIAEAKALQAGGDFSSSIEPLRDALAQDPDHSEANYLLGVALVQTRQPTLAIWPLRKAAQSETYAVPAGLALANTLLGTAGFEEALNAADNVLQLDPGNVTAMLIRAQSHLGTGKLEDALADTDAALTVAPDNDKALATRGVLLGKLDRIDEAEAVFAGISEKLSASGDPNNAMRGCVTMATFYTQYRPEKAEPAIQKCLEEDPASDLALRVAREYYDGHDQDAVVDDLYRKAIEEAPDQLPLRMTLAQRLATRGANDDAEAVLVEAAELFDDPQAWDRLALFRFGQGDLDGAREANDRALATTDEPPAILLFRKADLLVEDGKYDEAEAAVASLESMYRDAIHGRVLLKQGDDAGALAAFEASLLRWPNNAAVRYLAGQAAERAGDVEKARSHYREAVRSDDKATDAGLALASLELAQGNYEAAGAYAIRHFKNRPFRGPEAHVIAARAATAEGRYDAARNTLAQLAEKPGMEDRAATERAALESRAKGPQAAVDVLSESGMDLADPANAVALGIMCENLVALSRSDEALRLAAAARARSPEAAGPHDLEGRILAALGRSDEARAAFESALEADPDQGHPHYALGSMALAEGRVDDALREADAALAVDPDDSDARYLRARILFRQGKDDEGMALLREITEQDPGYMGAANDLAWRLAERGEDLEAALELASRAVRIEPRPETLDTLGFVQLRSDDPAGAVQSLARSLQLQSDPSVRYRLGLALDAVGRSDEALDAFREALAGGSFPEADEAREQIARLTPQAKAVP